MIGNVEICLRRITGCTGNFSPELEAYWREVERLYKCCNVMMVPETAIPLWHMRSVDQGVPIEAKPRTITVADPPPYVADVEDDPTIPKKMHWKTRQKLEREAALAEV